MTEANKQKLFEALTGFPAVVFLLAVYAVAAFTSMRDKCTTYDEIAYLTAGYSYWAYNDYRLMPESGNLPQRWVTLPLLLGNTKFPPLDDANWHNSHAYKLGYDFFYESGNDPDFMLACARSMMIVFGVVLGWVTYAWSRSLFGRRGGMLSLVVYSLSPTMLAHGRFAMADMAVTLTFTASLGCFWMALHRVSLGRVLLSCVVMGALIISKMSALLIAPLALMLIAIRLWGRRPMLVRLPRFHSIVHRPAPQLLAVAVLVLVHFTVVVLVIWASCGFRYETFGSVRSDHDQMEYGNTIDELTSDMPLGVAIRLARDHRLLPEPFLYGFSFLTKVLAHSQHPSFLNGNYTIRGWSRYFPYCFAVKTPLPVLLLLALAAYAVYVKHFRQAPSEKTSSWSERPNGHHGANRSVVSTVQAEAAALRRTRLFRAIYRTAPLWIFLAAYWMLAILQARNAGHRHILPVYPATFILAGAAAHWCQRGFVLLRLVIYGLLVMLAVDSFSTWPHYLAYFNQLAGGPSEGYRHLVDSSLDFGQDLPGLKRWLDKQGLGHPDGTPVFLAYSGMGSPKFYEIPATVLLSLIEGSSEVGDRPPVLTGGVYCISSYILQSVPLPAIGRWSIPYEIEYQSSLRELERLKQASEEPPQQLVLLFRRLRLARLCAYLRQREPDDQVGHTILIYRLSDEDVRQAFARDPAELEPEVRVDGL